MQFRSDLIKSEARFGDFWFVDDSFFASVGGYFYDKCVLFPLAL